MSQAAEVEEKPQKPVTGKRKPVTVSAAEKPGKKKK